MQGNNLVRVMVTQTWSWFNGQLDFPEQKRIKVHLLQPGRNRSYCGLVNLDDEGEMRAESIVSLEDEICSKCKKFSGFNVED